MTFTSRGEGERTIFAQRLGQVSYVKGCSCYDDVDVEEEMDVSEVKLPVNKTNKTKSKVFSLEKLYPLSQVPIP